MQKYSVISASNREDNKTKIFARHCFNILEKQGINVGFFNMEEFLPTILNTDMYDFANSPVDAIVEKYLKDVDKLLFVLPEYNGSFPGILKLFIDSVDPKVFKGKKAAMIGISSGRSGNVRGMDHLTSVLHYLKVNVYYYKLSIASIDGVLNGDEVSDQAVLKRLNSQLDGFNEY